MKTSKTFSIHFWLKKASKKTNGQIPIYARITVEGIRADISLKRSTNEKLWCPKAGRLNPRLAKSKTINRYLDDVHAKLLDCHRQLHSENVTITAQSIKLRYLGKDKKVSTLAELLDYHCIHEMPKLKKGTAKNYSATEKYLKRYINERFMTADISLMRLDYGFVDGFENYLRRCKPLRKGQPLKNNGIMKHMERFQKMMGVAYKFGWIKQNPFALYQLKFDEYDSDFLELEEIQRLEDVGVKEKGLRLVRDIFIFSCYTGLSYIEVKLLKQNDIVMGIDGEEWIQVRRKKTNTPVKVPLLEVARKILDSYSDYPNPSTQNTLLPVYSNQKVNKYLKELARRAQINKHLTFHVARHTFATTITLLNDVPLETVSKLLGHTKLSTTQRYARVVEKKISKDMQRLKLHLQTRTRQTLSYEETPFNHLQIVK